MTNVSPVRVVAVLAVTLAIYGHHFRKCAETIAT